MSEPRLDPETMHAQLHVLDRQIADFQRDRSQLVQDLVSALGFDSGRIDGNAVRASCAHFGGPDDEGARGQLQIDAVAEPVNADREQMSLGTATHFLITVEANGVQHPIRPDLDIAEVDGVVVNRSHGFISSVLAPAALAGDLFFDVRRAHMREYNAFPSTLGRDLPGNR